MQEGVSHGMHRSATAYLDSVWKYTIGFTDEALDEILCHNVALGDEPSKMIKKFERKCRSD
jgi:hypothetical protein